MSLLTATTTGPRPVKKGPPCTITKIIRTLERRIDNADTEDHAGSASKASLILANLYVVLDLRDEDGEYVWTAEEIATELRDDGFDVQAAAVRRHRRANKGGCKCEDI